MITEVSKIIFDRLTAQITNSGTAGLSGVKVWNEDRPREGSTNYVTFSIDTSSGLNGNAPIYELSIEVNCFSGTQSGAGQLAEAAIAALEGFDTTSNGVRITGVQSSGSVRSFDSDVNIWITIVRFNGLVIN